MRGNYGSRFIVDGDVLLRKHDLLLLSSVAVLLRWMSRRYGYVLFGTSANLIIFGSFSVRDVATFTDDLETVTFLPFRWRWQKTFPMKRWRRGRMWSGFGQLAERVFVRCFINERNGTKVHYSGNSQKVAKIQPYRLLLFVFEHQDSKNN